MGQLVAVVDCTMDDLDTISGICYRQGMRQMNCRGREIVPGTCEIMGNDVPAVLNVWDHYGEVARVVLARHRL